MTATVISNTSNIINKLTTSHNAYCTPVLDTVFPETACWEFLAYDYSATL